MFDDGLSVFVGELKFVTIACCVEKNGTEFGTITINNTRLLEFSKFHSNPKSYFGRRVDFIKPTTIS